MTRETPVSKKILSCLSRGKKILALLLVVAIFYFLFQALFANYEKLSRFSFRLHHRSLLVSLFWLVCTMLFNPWVWQRIMREMGEGMDYRQAFVILYVSHLGKYLPGRVWSYVSQVYLAKRQGFSEEKTLIASALFAVMSGLLSLYVFALSFLFWREVPPPARTAVFLLSSAVLFILLRGNGAEAAVHLVVNRIGRRNLPIRLKRKAVFQASAALFLSWPLYGGAYYVFLQALYPVDLASAAVFTGLYALSWLVGYVSLLTPGGLGVREGVLAYLLSFFLPLPVAIFLSLASRLWVTGGEIVVSLVALAMLARSKTHPFREAEVR